MSAMTAHPFMVGGTGRTCTDVMTQAAGRVFVKVGAEGVYAGGVTEQGLGLAIKVADGGRRAVEVALVRVLSELGGLSSDDVAAPILFLRRAGLPAPQGLKGFTDFMRWNGTIRAPGETFASLTRVSWGVVNFPWDGVSVPSAT